MSADNAVYIWPLPDGTYAVAAMHSLYPEAWTAEELDKEFLSHGIRCTTLLEADTKARREEQRLAVCEYGVVELKREECYGPDTDNSSLLPRQEEREALPDVPGDWCDGDA